MLFEDQPEVNAIATTKKDNQSQIIIIVSPRAQMMMMMMMMSSKCEEHADHTFSKKSLLFF